MSHEVYDIELAQAINSRRGSSVAALDCQPFLDTIPGELLESAPQTLESWPIGRITVTNTGLIIPAQTKDGSFVVMKLVPEPKSRQVFAIDLNTPEGRMASQWRTLEFGKRVNPEGTYKSIVPVTHYSIVKDVNSGHQQVYLGIGESQRSIPDRPMHLAVVMNDLVLEQPSVEQLLLQGETDYVGTVLGKTLAALHEKTRTLTPDEARETVGINVIEEVFYQNYRVFRNGIKAAESRTQKDETIGAIWTPELTVAIDDIPTSLFITHRRILEEVLNERANRGYYKELHRDLKPEHIYKIGKGIPFGSPMHSYFAFIDPARFNELLETGDTDIDLFHFATDIASRHTGDNNYLSVAEKVITTYKRATHQQQDFVDQFADAFYTLQALMIRYGVKNGIHGKSDDSANLFLQLIPRRISELQTLLDQKP